MSPPRRQPSHPQAGTRACDRKWITRSGNVRGRIAERTWELRIEHRTDGEWRWNGTPVPGLSDCRDLDFGFTPATNLLQMRRTTLAIGESADLPVAWLDLPEASLALLPQRYERLSATTYRYEAPTVGYSGVLEMNDSDFVRTYPGLWELDAPGRSDRFPSGILR
ncbi:MAG: putative glycolipid-binding domain-containing protein [Capsulimonadales bacterium]|nr:putative glycolipid-binding domain-containing protein [Capsulimonadales bacterium]